MNRTRLAAPLVILLALLISGCQMAPAVPEVTTPPAETTSPPEVAPPVSEPAVPAEPVASTPPPELKEPEPEPTPVVCVAPEPKKPAPSAPPQRPASVLPILGVYEQVTIEPPGTLMKARLDSGSAASQMDAREAREFERDGKPWVKFQVADPGTGQLVEVSRPLIRSVQAKSGIKHYVVSLRTRLGSIDQFTEFLLADRSGSTIPVVLGRDFLRDQALIDAARRYTVQPPKP